MKHKNGEQLLQHMELIDDEWIEAAESLPRKKRMLAWKLILPMAASLLLMVTLLAVTMIGGGAEDHETMLPENYEEWFVRPQEPYLDHELAETITTDMTLGEVVALMGKPNYYYDWTLDMIAPYLIWQLDDGLYLFILYNELYCPENNYPWDMSPLYLAVVGNEKVAPSPNDAAFVQSFYNERATEKYRKTIEEYWQNTDETDGESTTAEPIEPIVSVD